MEGDGALSYVMSSRLVTLRSFKALDIHNPTIANFNSTVEREVCM